MTTTRCDLCGVECSGTSTHVDVAYQASHGDIPVFAMPLKHFDVCPKCWTNLYAGKDKIRLVIEESKPSKFLEDLEKETGMS